MPPAKKKSAAKSGTVESAVRKVGEVLEPVSDAIASGAKAVGKGAKKVAETVGDAVSSAADAVTGGTEEQDEVGGLGEEVGRQEGWGEGQLEEVRHEGRPVEGRRQGDAPSGPRQGGHEGRCTKAAKQAASRATKRASAKKSS